MLTRKLLELCSKDLKSRMITTVFTFLLLVVFSVTSVLFTSCRTKTYSPDYTRPIIDKSQIERVKTDDPIHFQKVQAPDGTESPAFSYHPTARKFLNKLMHGGDYSVARQLMDKTFHSLKLKQMQKLNALPEDKREGVETNPLKIFLTAIENCKPLVKMTPVAKGGITYQVPVPIREVEREFRAMKLIIEVCLTTKERKMRFYDRLSNELILASNNEGQAVAKKIEIHKKAEANRAYAHYRWSK